MTGEVLDLCRVPAQDRSASLSRGCTSVLSMRGRDRAEGLRHGLRRPGRVCSSAAAFLAVCAALAADVLIPTGGPLIVNIDGDLVQVAPAVASHCARVRNEHAVLVCIGLSPRAQPRHPRSRERAQVDQEQTRPFADRNRCGRSRQFRLWRHGHVWLVHKSPYGSSSQSPCSARSALCVHVWAMHA